MAQQPADQPQEPDMRPQTDVISGMHPEHGPARPNSSSSPEQREGVALHGVRPWLSGNADPDSPQPQNEPDEEPGEHVPTEPEGLPPNQRRDPRLGAARQIERAREQPRNLRVVIGRMLTYLTDEEVNTLADHAVGMLQESP